MFNEITTVVGYKGEPWRGEAKECPCGAHFPHPSTTKRERQAWSFHLNDCEVYRAAYRAVQEQRAREDMLDQQSELASRLTADDVFTYTQAQRLAEVFGEMQ